MTKTLEQAVEDLNAVSDPEILLRKYVNVSSKSNKSPFRCSSCPVAMYLRSQTGKPVWVTSIGYASPADDTGWVIIPRIEYVLSSDIRELINKFDTEPRVGY